LSAGADQANDIRRVRLAVNDDEAVAGEIAGVFTDAL
jgi:hypothetical protein